MKLSFHSIYIICKATLCFIFFLCAHRSNAQLIFAKDTLLIPNVTINRLSLSPANHCWVIQNNNTEVSEITNTDQITDHTAGINTLTTSTLSEILAIDSGVVYIGTHYDYLVQYRNY